MKILRVAFYSLCIMYVCFTIACAPETQFDKIQESNRKQLKDEQKSAHVQTGVKYHKDTRTGLCFAGSKELGWDYSTLTNVPCSPEVEKLIEPWHE